MGSNIVETLVGTLVLVVAGFFLTYAYQTADMNNTAGGYKVIAQFDRVDGLVVGADVRMSGIKIGTVSDQALDQQTYYANVTMIIDKEVLLPEDTSAKITSEGLLGGSYISLEPGGSMDMLGEGGEITMTQGSIDLMGLIGKAIFATGQSDSE
ncbi:MAG: outer membrane lipid asymmetry maintenance protein MlaD [Alphaproteobacteria bacterium]|nr:MAG: outer membrane lipid asymmetry maintenance protein MlaD [Alphaproteobacteria bacterium]